METPTALVVHVTAGFMVAIGIGLLLWGGLIWAAMEMFGVVR